MISPSARLADILDAGVVGLDFFAAYLPRAHRVGVAGRVTVDGLRRRYDEQYGLDVSVLADDAAVLTRLVADLQSRVDEQTDAVRAMRSAWRGDAADLARDDLDRAAQRGAVLSDTVYALAGACTGAVEGITGAVAEKSDAIGRFDGTSVDGRTPEDIDTMIAGARGDAGGPTVEQVAGWCAKSGTPVPAPGGVAAWCERWLREVFAPTIQARIDRFIAACDIADDAVDDHLAAVVRAFDLLDAPTSAFEPESESTRSLGGGSGGAAGTMDRTSDVLRAAADLVDAGREFAEAVADLTGAVADLATTTVEGATVVAEAVTSVVAGHGAEGPVPPADQVTPAGQETPADPGAPTEAVPDSVEAEPMPRTGPAEPAGEPAPPARPEPTPQESSPDDARPSSGPAVTQVPSGGRATDRRTGTTGSATGIDSDEAESPRDDSDGVVLAEAGPL